MLIGKPHNPVEKQVVKRRLKKAKKLLFGLLAAGVHAILEVPRAKEYERAAEVAEIIDHCSLIKVDLDDFSFTLYSPDRRVAAALRRCSIEDELDM